MAFAALVRNGSSTVSGVEFGQGTIADRDLSGTSVRFWVVDSTEPDATEHDNIYILKEGGWEEITGASFNFAGTFN